MISNAQRNISKRSRNNYIKKDNFSLKGLGSFKIIHKKERLGRNPKTKEKFSISARNTISFTTSKKLSEILKNRYD